MVYIMRLHLIVESLLNPRLISRNLLLHWDHWNLRLLKTCKLLLLNLLFRHLIFKNNRLLFIVPPRWSTFVFNVGISSFSYQIVVVGVIIRGVRIIGWIVIIVR